MGVPAAPAAPQRDAVKAWQDAYRVLQHDAERWGQRLAAGTDPLSARDRQKLASLITQAEAMFKVGPKEAQIAAAVWAEGMTAQAFSLAAAMSELPQHAVASAREVATELGYKRIPNERAVRAVVNNEIGQLTSDYANMTVYQQQRLATDLANAVGQGMAPRELAANVSVVVDEWFRTGQARSVMIARTNMARAYDMSSRAVYMDATEKGLIKGWKWVAHGKDPCMVCLTLDGMVFPAEDDTYRHPNCTCTNVPVLMDAPGEVGERVNPRPDTSMDDLELYTSKSGWTSWRMKPKDPTGKATGKVAAKVVNNKVEPVGGVAAAQAAARARLEGRRIGRTAESEGAYRAWQSAEAEAKLARLAHNRFIDEFNSVRVAADKDWLGLTKSKERLNAARKKSTEAKKAFDATFDLDNAMEALNTVQSVGKVARAEAQRRFDAEMAGRTLTWQQQNQLRARVYREIVAEHREMSTSRKLDFYNKTRDKQPAKGFQPLPKKYHDTINDAFHTYPDEWQAAFQQKFPDLSVGKVRRGYFSESDELLGVSYTKDTALIGADGAVKNYTIAEDLMRVGTHEIGHGMERAVNGLLELEHAWWLRRVNNSDQSPIFFARKDNAYVPRSIAEPTPNWYTLKKYTGNGDIDRAYEIFTTGVQDLLGDGRMDYADNDLIDFVLGSLLTL
jgi:hypothetical protein